MLRRVALEARRLRLRKLDENDVFEKRLREAIEDARSLRVSKATALTLMEAMAGRGLQPPQRHVRALCDSLPGGPRAAQSLFYMVRLNIGTTANAYRLLRDSSRQVWENREVLHEIALAVNREKPEWWPPTVRRRGSHFIPLLMDSCKSLELTPIVVSPNQRTIVDDLDAIQVKSRCLAYMDAVVAPSLKLAFVAPDTSDALTPTSGDTRVFVAPDTSDALAPTLGDTSITPITAWRIELLTHHGWYVETLPPGFTHKDPSERRKILLHRALVAQRKRLPPRRRVFVR
eukprot:GEMP01059531.1.p1 GENE.GEMP01059531.1~~GEMP01059531.1.p1  ORF type:complete len:288 (+),score=66.13 GEMP01059531.1:76-939(+)